MGGRGKRELTKVGASGWEGIAAASRGSAGAAGALQARVQGGAGEQGVDRGGAERAAGTPQSLPAGQGDTYRAVGVGDLLIALRQVILHSLHSAGEAFEGRAEALRSSGGGQVLGQIDLAACLWLCVAVGVSTAAVSE